MQWNFKISNLKLNNDELYVCFSDHRKTNNDSSFKDVIINQLKLLFDDQKDIKDYLDFFTNEINQINSCVQIFAIDHLMPKWQKWKETPPKHPFKIAIVFQLEKYLRNYNCFAFFCDVIKEDNNYYLDLKRLEMYDVNLELKYSDFNENKICISNDKSPFNSIEWKEIIEDNDRTDLIKLYEWKDYLRLMKDVYSNKSDTEPDNFIFRYQNENYLSSKNELNRTNSKYCLVTNEGVLKLRSISKNQINFQDILEKEIQNCNQIIEQKKNEKDQANNNIKQYKEYLKEKTNDISNFKKLLKDYQEKQKKYSNQWIKKGQF